MNKSRFLLNRDIRGKSLHTGNFVHGHLIVWNKKYTIITYHFDESSEYIDSIDMEDVDPETLCECTGVQDSEGNWIFEGDIVSFDDAVLSSIWYSDDTGFMSNYIDVKPLKDYVKENVHMKVVGNVYDDPELME